MTGRIAWPRTSGRIVAVLALVAVVMVPTSGGAGSDLMSNPSVLRIDGRPFLPVGIYYPPVPKFETLRNMGFNVVHMWALRNGASTRGLDEAERLGLRAVVELADAYQGGRPYLEALREHVEAYRSHPAVLAWYLWDEPQPNALERVRQGYELVRALDPARPVFTLHVTPQSLAMFASYAEILGIDPYPVPNQRLSHVWRYVSEARQVVGAPRAVWTAIQAFAKAVPPRPTRYPTPVELRNMVYQALIAGATGILYFSYEWEGHLEERDPVLWAALGPVNREIGALAPVLLEGQPHAGSVRLRSFGDVRSLVRDWAGRTYVIVANVGPTQARVEVQQRGRPPARVEDFLEKRPLAPIDGRVTDIVEPYGVRVFVL